MLALHVLREATHGRCRFRGFVRHDRKAPVNDGWVAATAIAGALARP
jgi:hypothetical protein